MISELNNFTRRTSDNLTPKLSTLTSNYTTPSVPVHATVQLSKSDYLVIFIYVCIFVVGLCGNLLVIQYFGFHAKSKHSYNIYLIHLAVSDLISAVVTPISFAYGLISGNKWNFGSISCTIVSLIGPLTVNVSAWILASIAYERYRGITAPLALRWTKFQIHATVAIIWVASLVILIPYMISIDLIDNQCIPNWKEPVYELSSAVATLVLQSIMPILFMVYTVSKILKVLKNRQSVLCPSKESSTTTTSSKATSASTCPHIQVSDRNTFPISDPFVKRISVNFNSSVRSNPSGPNSSIYSKTISIASKSPVITPTSSMQSISSENYSYNFKKNGKPLTSRSPANLTVQGYDRYKRSYSAPNLKELIAPSTSYASSTTINSNECEDIFSTRPYDVNKDVAIQVHCPETPIESRDNARTNPLVKRKQAREEEHSKFHFEKDFPNCYKLGVRQTCGHIGIGQVFGHLSPVHRKKSISMCALTSYKGPKKASNVSTQRFHLTHELRPGKKISSTYRKIRNYLDHKREKGRARKQRDKISMLIVTFSVFVICSLPYNIFYVTAIVLLDFFHDFSSLKVLSELNLWLSTLVVTNSIMNCYIYAGMNIGFRRYCKSIIRCKSDSSMNQKNTSLHNQKSKLKLTKHLGKQAKPLLDKRYNLDGKRTTSACNADYKK